MTSPVPGGLTDAVAPVPEPGGPDLTGDTPRTLAGDAWRDLRRNPIFLVAAVFVLLIVSMAVAPGLWSHTDPGTCVLEHAREPSAPGHPFGYDGQGCDVYSQVIHGARASIVIGLLVTIVSTVIAIVLGSLSGFYGGWVDALIQRINDIFLGFPFILAALLLLTRLDAHNVWGVSLALIIFGWSIQARVMRGSVLGAKNQDYVAAARALGASDARILFRHVMPNAIAPVLVLATLTIGAIIGAEATLSFLGVGLQYPEISWGLELNSAGLYFYQAPHLLIFPALFLSVTVLSFILIGDAVRDAFDPKLR